MASDKAREAARQALRFPRPCKCFEESTIAPLPACRDGLCADAVNSIAEAIRAAQDEARREERKAIIDICTEREIACRRSAKKYKERYPDDAYWSASEMCAAQEAHYISRLVQERDKGKHNDG